MSKSIVWTFGRFQSPTHGHAKVINKTRDYAKAIGAEHRIYPSASHDDTKNPIPHGKKVAYLKDMFPGTNIINDKTANNPHSVARKLSDEGFKHVTMVAGSDRVEEFKQKIGKYVRPSTHKGYDPAKHYDFETFQVISAGDRDTGSGVAGTSGTKMREYARKGDFQSFASNTPSNPVTARKVYNTVRSHLKEDYNLLENRIDHKNFGPMLDSFVAFAAEKLGIDEYPKIVLDTGGLEYSFAAYVPHTKEMMVKTKNRHPMDIFRSVGHEMVHLKQDKEGRITDPSIDGATGSDIENEANAEAGKLMRWFAQENPKYFKLGYVTEEALDEGIHDPALHKVVFLAGGTGSGKDFVMNRTLKGHGMKEINSDIAFTHMMNKQGLSLSKMSMNVSDKQQREVVRNRAKLVTNQQQRLAADSRQGIIINGTADKFEKIEKLKNHYEGLGYKTSMVYVHASNETSKARNEKRSRKVPEEYRQQKWKDSYENKDKYHNLFGANFHHVDNSIDYDKASPDQKQKMDDEHLHLFKKIRKFTQEPNEHPEVLKWHEAERGRRKIMRENNSTPSDREWGKPSLSKLYAKETPGQEGLDLETKGKLIDKYYTPFNATIKRKTANKAKELTESVKRILKDGKKV